MKKKSVSLLDRARGHLASAKLLLAHGSGDEVEVDVAAHLCQLAVELCAKFLIESEGKTYVPRHETYIYLEDLENEKARELIDSIAARVDNWTATIRYSKTIRSSVNEIKRVAGVCEELIVLAEESMAKLNSVASHPACVKECRNLIENKNEATP
jgi:DNA phosphorothioation-dependent restriction protein DptG